MTILCDNNCAGFVELKVFLFGFALSGDTFPAAYIWLTVSLDDDRWKVSIGCFDALLGYCRKERQFLVTLWDAILMGYCRGRGYTAVK